MAKSIGLVGTLSGKAGNFVFCKGLDGRTVVRPYQPQVYNPKTTNQSLQRAKMVLAGELSKLAPSSLLVSLSQGRKVQNRSFFVANILRRAEADLRNGSYVAGIVPEDIVFGRGSAINGARCVGVTAGNATQISVDFNASAVPASDLGKVGVRVVVLVANKTNGIGFDEIAFADHIIATSTTFTVNVPVKAMVSGESYFCAYIIPFRLVDSVASQYGDGGNLSADAARLEAVLKSNPSMVKEWGDSSMYGDLEQYEDLD